MGRGSSNTKYQQTEANEEDKNVPGLLMKNLMKDYAIRVQEATVLSSNQNCSQAAGFKSSSSPFS